MLLICFSALTFLYMIHWIGLLFGLKQFNHFGKVCSEQWFWILLSTLGCIWNTYELSTDPAYNVPATWIPFTCYGLIMFFTMYTPVKNAITTFHKNQKIKRGNV